ncbi:OmpA family protein [Parvicella tangerina]|uniref:Peptidoglycan-associated lipoprotein n=1 Tax=Parvicella tangerina TaxID=2829795 RepID=A0A916JMJ0_9FLAO|nr:OmpA family protein [Parvicella tangerina]CAG5080928.1 Peptidoglycan-associated lipoprotein [Parvicella tangerina]
MKTFRITRKSILFAGVFVQSLVAMAFSQPDPPTTGVVIGDKEVVFEVHNVYGLNSEYAEFSPVLFKNELVFASDRVFDYRNLGEDNWEANKYINIFKATVEYRQADSIVFEKVGIYDRIFMEDDHSGPICFSADGKKAIFTKVSHRDARKSGFGEKTGLFAKTKIHPQLYEATFNDGKWSDIEKLSFVKVNKTYGHPTLSSDGNTLYFVSDEFGGKGGKDIFKVEMTTNGWGEPKAINALNTSSDELFPTIVGKDLYFASNGRGGEGGLDLFVARFEGGEWTEPINLGPTINTSADEFGIVFNPDHMSGYFTSNRENGEGADDIYYFDKIETVVVEDNSISGKFKYKLLQDKNPEGLEVMLLDEDGNLVATTRTNEDGSFNFKNLKSDQRYTVKLGKDGEDVELTLFGQESDAFLVANKDGEFVYRKLSDDNVGTLSLMDEESIDPVTREGTLSGQFVYTKLGDDAGGMEVLLLDEDGNIVQRTTTDENGNFIFKKLPSDQNYTIKTMEYSEDLELYIYNNSDQVTATLASDADGQFVYRKLDPDYASDLDNLKVDDEELKFEGMTHMISGEFKYRNLETPMKVVEYEIYDEDMTLLKKGETNEGSFFRHFSMPEVDKLVFKIDGDKYKEDVDLLILDRNKEIVIQLDKNEEGYFIYQKLKGDGDELMTEEELLATLKNEQGVAGQFLYKKLKTDNSFLEYEIYDEDGNLVKRGKTDRFGFFSEPDLDKNGKFKFKLLNGNENVKLRMYSDEDGELVVLDRGDDDFFAFGKLDDGSTALNIENESENEMLVRYNQGKLINNLFYAHNIYKLSGANKKKMDEIVTFLNNNKEAKIIVSAHASLIGSDEYNEKLSERRMQEVVNYLLDAGVEESRFKGQYFGEDNPLVDCSKKKCDESDHRQNRRTEISIVK